MVDGGGEPEHYGTAMPWFTHLVNHAGLPALSLPLEGTSDGSLPPVSIQLIAPWWEEHVLLGLGLALEAVGIVGFDSPPGASYIQ